MTYEGQNHLKGLKGTLNEPHHKNKRMPLSLKHCKTSAVIDPVLSTHALLATALTPLLKQTEHPESHARHNNRRKAR
jgi:hypothetical protein